MPCPVQAVSNSPIDSSEIFTSLEITNMSLPPQVAPLNSYQPSHNIVLGYLLWIFGFIGIHRFYYGRPLTGILWFCTLGLFFIGWIIDLFLIPAMARAADSRFAKGPLNYNIAWLLLIFLGLLGIHRMYQGKWLTGILYLLTGGLFLLGIIYDYLSLNGQVAEQNQLGTAPFSW